MKFTCLYHLLAVALVTTSCSVPNANTEKKPEKVAIATPVTTAAPLTDTDVQQDIRKLSPRNGKPQKIDENLRNYLEKNVSLTANQRVAVFCAMAGNAVKQADDDLWLAFLKMVYATPEGPEQKRLISEILRSQVNRWVTERIVFERLETLYRKHSADLAPDVAAGIMVNFADLAVRVLYNDAKFVSYYKALNTLKLSENVLKMQERAMLINYLKYDPVAAEKCFKKYSIPMPDRKEFLSSLIAYSVKEQDRKLYDRTVAEIALLPDGTEKNNLLVLAATQFGEVAQMEKLLAENKKLSYQNRWDLLNAIMQKNTPKGEARTGFYTRGQYEQFKNAGLRLDKLMMEQDERFAKDKKAERPTGDYHKMGVYFNLASTAFAYGDYDFSERMEAKIPKNFVSRGMELRVLQHIYRNDFKGAAVQYDLILNDPKASSRDKDFARVMVYFLNGGTYENFDATFAERKFTSAEKMNQIRACSRLFFKGKKFDRARELEQAVMKNLLKKPETDKTYNVQWVDIAPGSASAWAMTPAFNDWLQLDTRFLPYSGYGQDNATDTNRLLKEADVSLKEEYKVGTQLLCDDQGLHIYVRCEDPDVASIRTGKRAYGSIEGVFQPGSKHPYHWFMITNLPASTSKHNPDWATASKHYRRTEDSIQKDATITKTGVAAHFFFPWLSFWDKLPEKDNVWRYGLQIWGPDTRSSSGMVHELHRAIRLNFNFTAEQEIALKRQVALQAFYRYDRIRKDAGGVIQTWNDPVLGDPEFYRAELESFIADLDNAGKKLIAPASDAELLVIYNKYVPLWAEINYVLAEKREAYIKKQLFK